MYCLVKADLIVIEIFGLNQQIKANKIKEAFFGLFKGVFQYLALWIH